MVRKRERVREAIVLWFEVVSSLGFLNLLVDGLHEFMFGLFVPESEEEFLLFDFNGKILTVLISFSDSEELDSPEITGLRESASALTFNFPDL